MAMSDTIEYRGMTQFAAKKLSDPKENQRTRLNSWSTYRP